MGWLTQARVANKAYGNPKVEFYDPGEEQIRSMIQGIYESKVEEALGVPFYNARDQRVDVELPIETIRKFQKAAYRIGKGNAAKFGFSERVDGKVRPTRRCIHESEDRYHDYDNLLSNRQSYEETLGLVRVEGFYRVTAEPAGSELKYFVWPLLKGQVAPRAFDSQDAAQRECDRRNRESDPRKTGRRWTLPQKRITKKDLMNWLPYAQFWRLR
jgi:hypothetical protein